MEVAKWWMGNSEYALQDSSEPHGTFAGPAARKLVPEKRWQGEELGLATREMAVSQGRQAIWRGCSCTLPSLESVCEQTSVGQVLPAWAVGDQSQCVRLVMTN